jgi:hypothetical protein
MARGEKGAGGKGPAKAAGKGPAKAAGKGPAKAAGKKGGAEVVAPAEGSARLESVYGALLEKMDPGDNIRHIVRISDELREPLDRLAKVAEEHRAVLKKLGHRDSEELEKMILRLRSVNQQVAMAIRRYLEKGDEAFKALAIHNIDSLLRSEAAIDGLLAQNLLENLYLTDIDNPERWSMFQFSAPPFFASVVAALRHEMERRTGGRRIQDHDVILAAIRYCHVEIETVLAHPMFSGHLEALVKQPKVRPFPLVPVASQDEPTEGSGAGDLGGLGVVES